VSIVHPIPNVLRVKNAMAREPVFSKVTGMIAKRSVIKMIVTPDIVTDLGPVNLSPWMNPVVTRLRKLSVTRLMSVTAMARV
jgi:hypothetical protein